MMYDKDIERCDYKKNDGIAREPIAKSPPARAVKILLHRKRPDIAGTASIQIAGRTVVQGVLPAPVPVRRQKQQARKSTRRVVGSFGFKERRVAAVMKNNKDPDKKAGGQNCNREHQPVGND